jgi:hypothetical protein
MVAYTRKNALDQALDIAGSLLQSDTRILSDESDGYGGPISGQFGSGANITTVLSGIATVTGLTGMTVQSVGRMITISGAASASNNGTFLIVTFTSATSVNISNASAVASDANNGTIVWQERNPYSLEDDINFERTDRRLIKGTATFHDAVPTYERPSAIGTLVPANLTNIASKTLDAHAWIINKVYRADPVAFSDTFSLITATGFIQYADAINRIGVPIFDGFDAGDWNSTYIEIINPLTENMLLAVGGAQDGYRIFGRTRQGSTGVEPNSVEVQFFAVPLGAVITSATAYTWDGYQPTTVDYYYPYRTRADQLDENAFRTTLINGLFAPQQDNTDLTKILTTLGTSPTDTFLTLTPTTNYYIWSDLPDGTPSVTEALNTINEQVGDRIFTGTCIGDKDGYTITALLQSLADCIASASFVRIIERLVVDIVANTAHTIPGGNSYTLDGSDNGQNLVVYTRGVLRDPGPVADGNDYAETSTTSVTFYTKQKIQDHINYFIYS